MTRRLSSAAKTGGNFHRPAARVVGITDHHSADAHRVRPDQLLSSKQPLLLSLHSLAFFPAGKQRDGWLHIFFFFFFSLVLCV